MQSQLRTSSLWCSSRASGNRRQGATNNTASRPVTCTHHSAAARTSSLWCSSCGSVWIRLLISPAASSQSPAEHSSRHCCSASCAQLSLPGSGCVRTRCARRKTSTSTWCWCTRGGCGVWVRGGAVRVVCWAGAQALVSERRHQIAAQACTGAVPRSAAAAAASAPVAKPPEWCSRSCGGLQQAGGGGGSGGAGAQRRSGGSRRRAARAAPQPLSHCRAVHTSLTRCANVCHLCRFLRPWGAAGASRSSSELMVAAHRHARGTVRSDCWLRPFMLVSARWACCQITAGPWPRSHGAYPALGHGARWSSG